MLNNLDAMVNHAKERIAVLEGLDKVTDNAEDKINTLSDLDESKNNAMGSENFIDDEDDERHILQHYKINDTDFTCTAEFLRGQYIQIQLMDSTGKVAFSKKRDVDEDQRGCVIQEMINNKGINKSKIGPSGEEIIAFDIWTDISDTDEDAESALAEEDADYTIDHHLFAFSFDSSGKEYEFYFDSYSDGECELINTAREYRKENNSIVDI